MPKTKHRPKHKQALQKYRDEIALARQLGKDQELLDRLEAFQRDESSWPEDPII